MINITFSTPKCNDVSKIIQLAKHAVPMILKKRFADFFSRQAERPVFVLTMEGPLNEQRMLVGTIQSSATTYTMNKELTKESPDFDVVSKISQPTVTIVFPFTLEVREGTTEDELVIIIMANPRDLVV